MTVEPIRKYYSLELFHVGREQASQESIELAVVLLQEATPMKLGDMV